MRIEEIFEDSPFMNTYQERETYYHGTSDSVDIGDKLLPPDMTDTISEVGRKKNLDKVFFTSDIKSAEIYAGRATRELGGSPVVYEVSPVGKIETLNSNSGTTVYSAEWAYIKDRVK